MGVVKEEINPWQDYHKFGIKKYIEKNDIIYRQGSIGSGFYCVERGLIKIYTCAADGGEKNIDFRGKGQVFGELALIGEPYISTARAVQSSVIYYFSNEKFREMIRYNDGALNLVFNSLLIKLNDMVGQKMLSTAEQQIAHALLKLASIGGTNEIMIKQTELANFTGLTRITVGKFLKKWKKENVIEIQNKNIVINNKEYLSRYLYHNE